MLSLTGIGRSAVISRDVAIELIHALEADCDLRMQTNCAPALTRRLFEHGFELVLGESFRITVVVTHAS